MRDAECIAFLQWALPQLGLRWQGFRRVRRQVCRRLARRLSALGLENLESYRLYLQSRTDEWQALDRLCRVTISRFFRDRGLWMTLQRRVLPRCVERASRDGRTTLRAWSAGCASGEEPYSLAILWHSALLGHLPQLRLAILGTDTDLTLLARARRGVYSTGSLREVEPMGASAAFEPDGSGAFRLRRQFRTDVRFAALDVKSEAPAAAFDLILCRNLAFTYYDTPLQVAILDIVRSHLLPGGCLVIGSHERLPEDVAHQQAAPGVIEFPGA